MNEPQAIPISAYSEEEWAATIRYAEEHASEISLRDRLTNEQVVLPPPAPPAGSAPKNELAATIFDMVNTMNRAYAAQLRRLP